MNSQSFESPNQDNFGTPFWESQEKMPFGCRCGGKHREYYMGEGGGFLRVWAVVSQVNPGSLVACFGTKSAPECELTNLLVDLMQVQAIK
jgi:hypothetical protein